jgi:hypothetical protein
LKHELLTHVSGRVGAQHYRAQRQDSGEAKAEQLVRDELKRLRWKEADLAERRKGDRGEMRMAWRLRRETTISLQWIANRLQMGVWTHVPNLLGARAVTLRKWSGNRSVNSEALSLMSGPILRAILTGRHADLLFEDHAEVLAVLEPGPFCDLRHGQVG